MTIPLRFPILVLSALLGANPLQAQPYPTKPSRFVLLAADGSEAVGSSRQAFAAHVNAGHDKWSKVIWETGIKGR